MSNRSYSALTLLAAVGLASSLMACSKEEEKKTGWSCHSADVPQGEVLRCTSAALTEDGTSTPTSITTDGFYGPTAGGGAGGEGTLPVGTDATSNTGTATGGTGGTATGGTTIGSDATSTVSIGAGSGYGTGSFATTSPVGVDSTVSVGTLVTYDCFPGDTNPDCPPADAYNGMDTAGAGGTSTGASLNTDGTTSTGDTATTGGAGSTTGTGTGTGGGSTTTTGSTDSTTSTGTTTGGTGSETGSTGTGTGGGSGSTTDGTGLTSDGTSSTGKGNGNGGGGAGSTNKYPGPDECAYVPDLPYCANGSAGSSTSGAPGPGGAAGGATSSTPEGSTTSNTTDGTSSKGNGNGGTGGNGSKSGDGSTTTTGGTGSTTGSGSTTGTTDGTASAGTPSGGGSSTGSGSSTTGGGGSSAGGGKKTGKHYKCVKDGKGNKSCESIPDCPTGSTPSNGACVESSSSGGTADGTNGGSTPSGSSTPSSNPEVLPPEMGGCWVTGGGFIISKNNLSGAAADGHDNYGGNAKPMKDGRIQGHWNHVDHGTGNHAKGKPEYIVCRKIDSEPGPGQPGCKKGHCMNQVYFGGHAEWRDHAKGVWESGYWFDVVAKDHGEPGSEPHAKNQGFPDTYHFTIRKIDDPANLASGTVVYETGRDSVKGGDGIIVGGNIQIHPPNNGHPFTAMTLPSWVKFENPAQ